MLTAVNDQVPLFGPPLVTDGTSALVSGLVWQHRTTVVTGVSKTQLSLQLAHAVAAGQPFLELPVAYPTPVLYIGRLRSDDLAYRLRNLASYFGAPKSELRYASSKGMFIGEKEVRALVQEHRPGLLVLDALLLHLETNAIIRHFGCAVVLVHPCEVVADTVAVLAEDEEDSSDYPTFALCIKRLGREQPLKVRRLGAIFKRIS